MGLKLGVGLGLGFRGGSNVNQPYDPATDADVSLWIKERSGLSLIDSIAANNAAIRLPVADASWTDSTHYLKCDSGITPAANTVWVIKGKASLTNSGILNGIDGGSFFFVGIYPGTGKWRLGYGNRSTQSVANADTDYHVFIIYNGSLWVRPSNTLMTDVSILNVIATVTPDIVSASPTWTTANRSITFGCLNAAYNSGGSFVYSESYIGTITTGAITWQRKYIFNSIYYAYDTLNAANSAAWVNGLNATPARPTLAYNEHGSTYCLDNGHTLLQKDQKTFISVPYADESPNTTVAIPTGFAKVKDFAGSATKLNYTDCIIRFVGTQFDRSNTTIFSAQARDATTCYDSGNVNDWHVTELNRNWLDSWLNSDYRGRLWIKTDSNSMDIADFTNISEVLTLSVNKTGADFDSVLTYTGDYTLYYYPLWDKRNFTSADYLASINNISAITSQGTTITELTALTGIDNFCGSILARNGFIYGLPFTNHNVLKFNPITDTYVLQPITLITAAQMKWRGAALAYNDAIYCLPFNDDQIFKINTINDTQSLIGDFGSDVYKYNSAILAPNGFIYGIPFNATNILKINPIDDTTSTFGSLDGTAKFGQAILIGTDIYVMPMTYGSIVKINTLTDEISTIAYTNPGELNNHWWGCAATEDGIIYGAPYNDNRILVIDTNSDTVTYLACDATVSGENYCGAVYRGDGIVDFIPHNKARFMRLDTKTNTISYYGDLSAYGNFKYYDGIVAENGAMYCIGMGTVPHLKVGPGSEINKHIVMSRLINNV